jgi:hypothetical protein
VKDKILAPYLPVVLTKFLLALVGLVLGIFDPNLSVVLTEFLLLFLRLSSVQQPGSGGIYQLCPHCGGQSPEPGGRCEQGSALWHQPPPLCRLHALLQVHFSVADPDPNRDPDPSAPCVFGLWIRILLSSSKNSKKNLDSYCFVTSF